MFFSISPSPRHCRALTFVAALALVAVGCGDDSSPAKADHGSSDGSHAFEQGSPDAGPPPDRGPPNEAGHYPDLPPAGDGPAQQAGVLSWKKLTSGTTKELRAIWGTSASDVFFVGADGTILRYDGTQVSAMTSGVTDSLKGVWGSANNDVYAVGFLGLLLHYDSTSWKKITSPVTSSLASIWGSGADNIIAVGSGKSIRYDGSTWKETPTGISSYLNGVFVNSKQSALAVGANGEAAHFNGSTWTALTTKSNTNLNGVWGNGTRYYAAGFMFPSGEVLEIDGTTVKTISQGNPGRLYGIGGHGDAVYVVGSAGTVLRYEGGTWASESPAGLQSDIDAVWAAGPKDVFIAGADGVIYHGTR